MDSEHHQLKKPTKTLRRKIKGFIKSGDPQHATGSGSVLEQEQKDMEWRRAAVGSVQITDQFKEEQYKCRLLGECLLTTLKPSDCYEFALRCANSFRHKNLPKGAIVLCQNSFRFANFAPKLDSEQPATVAATTIFDDSFRPRVSTTGAPLLRSTFTPSGRPVFHLADLATAETIVDVPISKVAYCGVIPARPEVFLVTSRDRERLVCRVFVFSKRHKARACRRGVAVRFERAYREWQGRFVVASGGTSRHSSVRSLPPATPNRSPYVVPRRHHLKQRARDQGADDVTKPLRVGALKWTKRR